VADTLDEAKAAFRGPSGGAADSLDEAKAAFRHRWEPCHGMRPATREQSIKAHGSARSRAQWLAKL
jgi:hypothetical protein